MALMDIGLVYDPAKRRCDHAFNGTDLVLDFTPVTPALVALGCDRRARTDDELPDVGGDFYAPTLINPHRGTPIDALDPRGRLVGSRLWLLMRRKHDEATRRLAETAVAEALDPIAADTGLKVSIMVRWLQRNMLGIRAAIGKTTFDLNQAVGQ